MIEEYDETLDLRKLECGFNMHKMSTLTFQIKTNIRSQKIKSLIQEMKYLADKLDYKIIEYN